MAKNALPDNKNLKTQKGSSPRMDEKEEWRLAGQYFSDYLMIIFREIASEKGVDINIIPKFIQKSDLVRELQPISEGFIKTEETDYSRSERIVVGKLYWMSDEELRALEMRVNKLGIASLRTSIPDKRERIIGGGYDLNEPSNFEYLQEAVIKHCIKGKGEMIYTTRNDYNFGTKRKNGADMF